MPKELVVIARAGAQGRRQLLAGAGVAVLSVGAGAGPLGLVRSYLNNNNFTAYDGTETFAHNGVTAPITPNSEHYVVTQNPIDPAVNLEVWRLEGTGLVSNPRTYTYKQMQTLPPTSRAITPSSIDS